MKKKTKHRSVALPSVKLYTEDLREIVDILKTLKTEVTISDNEYDYESVEELAKSSRRRISKLEIHTVAPSLYVEFNRGDLIFSTSIRLYTADPTAISAFFQIMEHLRSKRRWFTYILNYSTALAAVAVIIADLNMPPSWAGKMRLSSALQGVIAISFFLLIIISLLTRTGFFYSIEIVERDQRQSFWTRNKDNIVLAVISAMLGALGSWMISKLIGN